MSKEKQIEEMEKLQDELIKRSCTEFNNKTSMLLTSAAKAVGLLFETYRKQSEGEWGYDEGLDCFVCNVCYNSELNNYRGLSVNSKFCPHFGAKMKGGE